MRYGFSLVELSIVLVILGLLTGGILAGQSLIRASELRAVTTEYNRHVTAIQTFRDKYFALPGDMTNAEKFWGTLAVADTDCLTNDSTDARTCNGDGDGNIELLTVRSREHLRMWQQLANAGLIEGKYRGNSVTIAYNYDAVPGENVPRSKLGQAGWAVMARSDVPVHNGWYLQIFQPNSNHWMEFGNQSTNALLLTPALKSEEAWNLDTKLDDGKPGSGKFTQFNNSARPNCVSSDVAATAEYQLSVSGNNCVPLFGF